MQLERRQQALLKRGIEGAHKHALCCGPPLATWRHHLQKSALSSYARRPPLLWTSGRDPPLVARRRHASTASPSRAFVPALSRPTRPTARVNCTHRGPVTMFQCRSQSPGGKRHAAAPACQFLLYPTARALASHCARDLQQIYRRGCRVVTDCKRRPSRGLPGQGRPCPLAPRDEPRPLS